MIVTLIILGLAVLAVVYAISVYNRLVTLKNRYLNSFSQIEVQLKRRYDLIPNLVETVKGYISHERETLEAVIQARNQASALLKEASAAGTGSSIQSLGQAEGSLTSALGRFNMVMEAYPDLKASENVKQLSEELTSTENKVAFARQAYNDGVTQYNIFRQSFPPVFFAPFFGHSTDASLLEFADSEQFQNPPKVSL